MRLSLLLICLFILPTYAFSASLTIGSALNRPPYIIEDAESGLEIDIIKAAFKEMGQPVNFKFYSRKRQVLYFNKDRLDAVMTMNPANGVDGYWSNDYVEYTNVAISLAEQHLEITRIVDLKKYSVAAFENARFLLGPEFNAVAQQTIYREVDSQLSQNRMLYLGRINTVIADRYIFAQLNKFVEDDVDTQQALSYHFIFPPTSYRMVFHNSVARDTFNQGLARIKANGIYQALVAKYLGSA
ncbi:transporter substrate-binding domain-containing protein [Shewanella sp. M16]|uniref:substrate-binding periplasmic protein n=1 Tax=Shewanella TaxID=22 RepID=UPI001B4A0F1A|nr:MULTISPECIES: transporter substrate-binding domain-containing protein [unclassified Shewanella]MBP8118889.1 transporter substrate-binding domain-containing protein [Shewanella sp.]MBS0043209.1 transporter substrate-binding domain-containing protein [Shewanella sp. M16]MCU7963928.1 transporter substrate-binding domain-containing protein [Shewanella sp. SW32]MCU7973205.1 transporter substrate-binding domain-containing protein [Shewanella sp. SW29]